MLGLLLILCLISLGISLILNKVILPQLIRLKAGQTVRDDGPESHFKKNGTPTMGGVIFIFSTIVTSIGTVFYMKSKLNFDSLYLTLLSMILFGIVGFLDDYIKVVKKQSLGLNAKQKILLQFIFAIIISVGSIIINDNLDVYIPILKENIDIGYFYLPFSIFVIISLVNSVNLTDGLDGLASFVTIIVSVIFIFIAHKFTNESLQFFLAILIGACIGFLKLNRYPAKVFMGDTGSMALGGAIAGVSTLLRVELIVPLVCFIYFMESVSVIVQVLYFKKTGKRFFKMAPIHHHFEKLGWHETKVVKIFCFVTLAMGLLSIYLI